MTPLTLHQDKEGGARDWLETQEHCGNNCSVNFTHIQTKLWGRFFRYLRFAVEPVHHRIMNQADGLTNYIARVFRRYSRDPAGRADASRLLMIAAIALCAEHNNLGETGLLAAEALAELKRQARASERLAG